jgi:hypothetical protein
MEMVRVAAQRYEHARALDSITIFDDLQHEYRVRLAAATGSRTPIDDIVARANFTSCIEGVELGNRKGRWLYGSRIPAIPEPIRCAHEHSAEHCGAGANQDVAGPLRLPTPRHEASR